MQHALRIVTLCLAFVLTGYSPLGADDHEMTEDAVAAAINKRHMEPPGIEIVGGGPAKPGEYPWLVSPRPAQR